MRKSTNTLNRILEETRPEEIRDYLEENEEELISEDRPFAAYMRHCIREKGISQQEVFIRADFSESYGYKILSEEKHTRQRDTILRLCIAAGMEEEEIQRALRIYGMSPLYPRVPRDALILTAIRTGTKDVQDLNEILTRQGFPAFKGTED